MKHSTIVGDESGEHRSAEKELLKSEERLRLVLEANSEGVWDWNIQTGDAYFSPHYSGMLGYTPEEFAKSYANWKDMVHPDDFERVNKAHMDHIHGYKDFCVELRMRKKSGEWCWILSRGTVVERDAEGRAVRMVGTHLDITERKRTEEELKKHREHLEDMIKERTAELLIAKNQAEAANRAKSAFLANMSHELRTPLASILGVCQLLERDPEFPPKRSNLLAILDRSGKQLFELIDDVLTLSKIDAGPSSSVIVAPFDLHCFLEDLVGSLASHAEKKGLEMALELDSTLPRYIRTDAPKLRQILINFLSNAIKFTEKGRVVLRAKQQESNEVVRGIDAAWSLQFEVEDTGIGIGPEDVGRIFEMFVQLKPSRSPSGGVGLGLAISKKLAGLLGGEITLRSELGRGSIFQLNIGAQEVQNGDIPEPAVVRRVTGLASGQPS